MNRAIFAFSILLAISLALAQDEARAAKRVFGFNDLFAMKRIGSFSVSKDGSSVAFTLTAFDKDANSSNTDIWLVTTAGGKARAFVASAGDDNSPAWSADGKYLAFISNRDGSSQIWTIPTDGGEARRLTNIPTEISNFVLSPDGRYIALTSSVYPDCPDMDCNEKSLKEKELSPIKAELIDRLLYRHWNSWRAGRWEHLFLFDTKDSSLVEITKGCTDVPPIALGGDRDIEFSPDGKELCFVMNSDSFVASSTNNDLYIMEVPAGKPKNITAANLANDNNPRYSPDGRWIAYRAMLRPGFEADRVRIMLYDRKTGSTRNLTENFDYSIDNISWGKDSRSIYFTVSDRGSRSMGSVSIAGNDAHFIIRGSYDTDLEVTSGGRFIVFARQSATSPVELYRCTTDGKKVTKLTDINGPALADIEMNPIEEFWFEGAYEERVQGFILKPPGFDPNKKYPLVLLIHGGPQGSFGDDFHYRWNWQMFAAPGYVAAAINFHGSTGYGQSFTDAISGDWGGAPFEDILKGLEYLKKLPYVDASRIAAAGASYGGYMINWLEGHTEGIFKCFVSHSGVYNLESMYGATEELWFPEWELRGTPWSNPQMYAKWSPHRAAANFKTPCLVIHGEKDFRVPVTESMQFFTALQRQGVPSKFLYFPDECHFVQKPRNAELWWKTVHDWLAQYLK